MRDHDPVWWGNRPSERDYYSYYNTEQESTLKQMLGALCSAFGTEPNPTYLHSYLHGNPAARSLFFSSVFHPSLAFALSLCLSLYICIPPLSLPPSLPIYCLKSNTLSHINFDQSNALICLAEETVTYWCRFSYREMKKARHPVSQNISMLTQTFTPHFIFSHSSSKKSQIYPWNFYLLRWLIVPSSPSRCGREGFIMITVPGIWVYIFFLTNLLRWYKMLCILASMAFDSCTA